MLGRKPNIHEIADALGMTTDEWHVQWVDKYRVLHSIWEVDLSQIPDTNPEILSSLDSKIDMMFIMERLKTLPSIQREIVERHAIYDESFSAIASALGKSGSSVRANYYKAIETLKEDYEAEISEDPC